MTWSVRGIDDEVRETALAAARRSGKPVGEWLNSIIRETATRQDGQPVAAVPSPPSQDPAVVDDLQRSLSDLATRLERLKSARTFPPPPRPHRAPLAAPAPAASAPSSRGGRVQDNLDEIAAELDRHLERTRPVPRPAPAASEPSFVPEPATDPRLSAVLSALDTLDRRLQTIAVAAPPAPKPAPLAAPAPRPTAPVAATERPPEPILAPRRMPPAPMPASPLPDLAADELDAAIAEIGRRQRVLAPESPTGPIIRPAARPLLASDVDKHFRQLAERLDKLGTEPATPAVPDHLEAELRDLRALVEEGFDRRIAPLAETVASLAASLDTGLRRMEERLEAGDPGLALRPVMDEIARLRADLSGQQPGDAALRNIELGYGDIRHRLDDLHQVTAETRFDPAVVDGVRAEIADLRVSVENASAATITGLENRLVAIGRRIDQLVAGRGETFAAVDTLRQSLEAMPAPEPVDLAPLDARFDALDARLSGIAAIEAQLHVLGQHLAAMTRTPAAQSDIAPRIVQDIAALSARIEALAAEPSQDDLEIRQGLATIVAQVDRLGARFDQMTPPALPPARDDSAVHRGLHEIVERLEDIGGRIEQLEARAPSTAAPALAYDPEDLALKAAEAISARIDALADRIDGVAMPAPRAEDPDQSLMAAIDERFARIVRQLDTAEDRFASLGAIEDALGEIRTVLSSRTPMGDPTREAMREAVAEFVRLSQDAGPAAAVVSIANELGQLKSQTRDLEARTSDGLKAVQEALTSVASLLQSRATAETGRPVGRAYGREDTRPIEPGSGKPLLAPEPPVPAHPAIGGEAEDGSETQPLRRADFIAAARRAAQAAQTAKLAEPKPAAEAAEEADSVRQPGALARIGAALRGRAKPVAIIVGVLLLAGIAAELTLNNTEAIRRGLANVPSPMALLEKFRTPNADPVRTAAIAPRKDSPAQLIVAAPQPAPIAPEIKAPVNKAAEPAPLTPLPAQPGSFDKAPAIAEAPANRFVSSPKAEGVDAKPVEVATAPVAVPPEVDPVSTQGIGQVAAPRAIDLKPAEAKPAAEIKPIAALAPVKANWPLVSDEKVGSFAMRKAAAGGDPRAAFEIGLRYADGRGITQNGPAAVEWYRRAAEAGFAPAQYRLASGLEKGLAGTRDLAEAKRWYQAAAEKGNVRAMHNLGVLHANDRDMTNALAWFQKAAEHGQRDSQFNLGIVYALGSGVKQDVATSYKWFALAAQQGDLEATKKRDDLVQYLDKTTLASAKMAVETWKPQTIAKETNDETTPWTEVSLDGQSLGSAGEKIARAQTLLKTQGKFAGEVNGQLTEDTKTAVKAFQRKAGLKPTGEVDDALIRALTPKAG